MIPNRIRPLFLILVAMLLSIVMTACGTFQLTPYSITVVDAAGEPIEGLIVRCLDAAVITDSSGNAQLNLPPDDYILRFGWQDGTPCYTQFPVSVTPENPTVTVTCYADALSVPSTGDQYTERGFYPLLEGSYPSLKLEESGMSYYVFTPTRSGIYRISAQADSSISIGYYGNSGYVLSNSLVKENGESILLEVKKNSIGNSPDSTTDYVIGISHESTGLQTCAVRIEWISEVAPSPEDEPWVAARAEEKYLTVFTGKIGATLRDMDISDAGILPVYNPEDGYYHVFNENGPVLMLRVKSASAYLDSFSKICGVSALGVYEYRQDGSLRQKIQYNDMLNEYMTLCDANGLVPLNDQLIRMIQDVGNFKGWWDTSSPGYIFSDHKIDPEKAWLFACCYYE